MDKLEFHKKRDDEPIPWDLLLSADPSRELVEDYLNKGEIYIASMDKHLVGEYVLTKEHENILELKNIAVDEKYQGQGFGKKLVLDAIEQAKKQNVKRIEVGTGNSSLSQLAFYQKCGFRITGVDTDFFIRNYKVPIIENGIACKDMIRLAISL